MILDMRLYFRNKGFTSTCCLIAIPYDRYIHTFVLINKRIPEPNHWNIPIGRSDDVQLLKSPHHVRSGRAFADVDHRLNEHLQGAFDDFC